MRYEIVCYRDIEPNARLLTKEGGDSRCAASHRVRCKLGNRAYVCGEGRRQVLQSVRL